MSPVALATAYTTMSPVALATASTMVSLVAGMAIGAGAVLVVFAVRGLRVPAPDKPSAGDDVAPANPTEAGDAPGAAGTDQDAAADAASAG